MCDPVSLIAGGTSIVSGIMGKKSADKQAKATRQASAQQAAETKAASQLAYGNTMEAVGQYAENDPFMALGAGATNQMRSLMGYDGSDPTEALRATPGYQFRLKQGLDSVQHSLGAQNALYSGAALKGIERYGQEFASAEYANAFERNRAIMTGASASGGNILNAKTNAEINRATGYSNAATQMMEGQTASAAIKTAGTQALIGGIQGLGAAAGDYAGTLAAKVPGVTGATPHSSPAPVAGQRPASNNPAPVAGQRPASNKRPI